MQGTGKGGVGMNRSKWIAALVAVGLLALGWPVRAQVGADGTKYTAATGTRIVGAKADSSQKLIGADGSGSGLNVYNTNAAHLLDFNVVNLISSVAIDTGGTGGANFRYSAPLDVRQYSGGNIVIHITSASAADTVGTYVYGVTLFPLTSATADWTTVGVPVPVAGFFNPYTAAQGMVRDTVGFFRVPLAGAAMDGEKFIQLKTDRDNTNYANIEAGKTVSIPWQFWLGPFARPRYLMVQVRLASKTITGNLTPSVRVDLEGLR